MKKKLILVYFIVLCSALSFQPLFSTTKPLSLNIQAVVELGRENLMFQNIESICEDLEENFYVLDSKAFKVYKFSPKGKLLLSFGSRGEGPGEFRMPCYLHLAGEKVIVCDAQVFVYFFDTQGKYLNRIRINKGLDISYLGPDLYYGWTWIPNGREQFLLNSKGEVIKKLFAVSRELSSVSAPDETGRLVQTNYSRPEYSPTFLFNNFRDRSVFARTDKYKILLVDNTGKILKEITHDTKPLAITPAEKKIFIHKIEEQRYIHKPLKKEFIKRIPAIKNYFQAVLVSPGNIFVIRVKKDITKENTPFPVDVFNHQGEYLGSTTILHEPMVISKNYIYTVKEEDEELLLIKYKWKLN